jgi:hypothetical protein
MDEYYVTKKGETTRIVSLTQLLAERANVMDRLEQVNKRIADMDLARDELDGVLCYFRNEDKRRG